MKNPNIAKVDSKGRILIPMHIRRGMKMEEGTEIVIMHDNDSTHAKIMPLVKDKTAELKLMLNGPMGSIGGIGDMLAANNFNILLSESRMVGEGVTEWRIIADVSGCGGRVKEMQDVIMNMDNVTHADISVK